MEHFIGCDIAGEGEMRSLCIMHKEGNVLVIDEQFKSSDEDEFNKKLEELKLKYNYKPIKVNYKKNHSQRIENMMPNILGNKIFLKPNKL